VYREVRSIFVTINEFLKSRCVCLCLVYFLKDSSKPLESRYPSVTASQMALSSLTAGKLCISTCICWPVLRLVPSSEAHEAEPEPFKSRQLNIPGKVE